MNRWTVTATDDKKIIKETCFDLEESVCRFISKGYRIIGVTKIQ